MTLYSNELVKLCNSRHPKGLAQRKGAGGVWEPVGWSAPLWMSAPPSLTHQTALPKGREAALCTEYPRGKPELPCQSRTSSETWEEVLWSSAFLFYIEWTPESGTRTARWHMQLYFSATLKKQANGPWPGSSVGWSIILIWQGCSIPSEGTYKRHPMNA